MAEQQPHETDIFDFANPLFARLEDDASETIEILKSEHLTRVAGYIEHERRDGELDEWYIAHSEHGLDHEAMQAAQTVHDARQAGMDDEQILGEAHNMLEVFAARAQAKEDALRAESAAIRARLSTDRPHIVVEQPQRIGASILGKFARGRNRSV